MPTRPKKDDLTLDDVRSLIKEVRADGLKIQSHYKKLEQEYSDWEDRVKELEDIIYQAELDTGLKKEEIYKEPIREQKIEEFDGIDISELEGLEDLDYINIQDQQTDEGLLDELIRK